LSNDRRDAGGIVQGRNKLSLAATPLAAKQGKEALMRLDEMGIVLFDLGYMRLPVIEPLPCFAYVWIAFW
jgi:hypothetical protein